MASKQDPPQAAKDFEVKLDTIISNGYTTIGIAIGFELGLFDVLAELKEPKTSQEIADAADMKERYVREWLGGMVTGGIVELDSTDKYFLPSNRIPLLTTDGNNNQTATLSMMMPTFGGEIYEKIKTCFAPDGPRGTSYEDYAGTCSAINSFTSKFLGNDLTGSFIPLHHELKKRLDDGITVADICCGKGVSTTSFAKAFPKSTFYGLDFTHKSITSAMDTGKGLPLTNCHFLEKDVANLPADWTNKFDYVFMHDALHDQSNPEKVLKGIHRILAPEGTFSVIEPHSYTKLRDNRDKIHGIEIFYIISLMHCMPVSLFFKGGMGLGTVWGSERAIEMLTKANFDLCSSHKVEGTAQWHFYCKKMK